MAAGVMCSGVETLLVFSVTLLRLSVLCDDSRPPKGPHSTEEIGGQCPAKDGSCVQDQSAPCTWQSREGVWYSLKPLLNNHFHVALKNPEGSILQFNLCPNSGPQIQCKDGVKSPACITVPGVPPTSTGKNLLVEQLEPNIPSMGMRLVYEGGDTCEITKVPRKTIIKIPCNRGAVFTHQNWNPKQAWEGKKKEVCHYFVEFPPSVFGCPIELGGSLMTDQSHLLSEDTVTTFHHPQQHPVPEILAVTGCVDSDPARTTRECHFAGKINLILHGINFHSMCNLATPSPTISPSCVNDFSSRFSVLVGVAECSQVGLVSQYQINCTVEKAVGENLDVVIRRKGVEGSVDSRDRKSVV